jgi:hypothetical protein
MISGKLIAVIFIKVVNNANAIIGKLQTFFHAKADRQLFSA